MIAISIGLIMSALAASLSMPLQVSIFGTMLFGIPHIVGDFKYLFLKPELAWSAKSLVIVYSLLLLILCFNLERAWIPFVGFSSIFAMTIFPIQRPYFIWQRLTVWILVVPLCTLAILNPMPFSFSLIFIHNVITIFIMAAMFPHHKKILATVITATVIGSFITSFSPDSTKLLVFLQLVHYLVWIFWIPAMVRIDTGQKASALWIIIPFSIGLCMACGLQIAGDHVLWRNRYLWFAQFHIFLELAVLSYLFVQQKILKQSFMNS